MPGTAPNQPGNVFRPIAPLLLPHTVHIPLVTSTFNFPQGGAPVLTAPPKHQTLFSRLLQDPPFPSTLNNATHLTGQPLFPYPAQPMLLQTTFVPQSLPVSAVLGQEDKLRLRLFSLIQGMVPSLPAIEGSVEDILRILCQRCGYRTLLDLMESPSKLKQQVRFHTLYQISCVPPNFVSLPC